MEWHTFNHPTGDVLNKIYKQIWTRELGKIGFFGFQQDPLRKQASNPFIRVNRDS